MLKKKTYEGCVSAKWKVSLVFIQQDSDSCFKMKTWSVKQNEDTQNILLTMHIKPQQSHMHICSKTAKFKINVGRSSLRTITDLMLKIFRHIAPVLPSNGHLWLLHLYPSQNCFQDRWSFPASELFIHLGQKTWPQVYHPPSKTCSFQDVKVPQFVLTTSQPSFCWISAQFFQ